MTTKTTTLAEIRDSATDEGVWVNYPFEAIVRNGTAAQGKKPSKATLYDPNDPSIKVGACRFGGFASFIEYEGKVVRFAGNGTKAKTYNGNVEITFSKNAEFIEVGNAAPAKPAAPAAPHDDSRGSGDEPPAAPPPPRPKVDPTTYFHRELAKKGLLWVHCFQYALNGQAKIGKPLAPDLFQAFVSTLYISADRQGLIAHVPALREVGSDGIPLRFVPPAPDTAAIEAEKKKHEAELEAQRKAWEAEQAAKRARAAAAPAAPQENLDEDVPF